MIHNFKSSLLVLWATLSLTSALFAEGNTSPEIPDQQNISEDTKQIKLTPDGFFPTDIVVTNECARVPKANFNTYDSFFFRSGQYYKEKGCKAYSIQNQVVIVKSPEEDPTATLNEFKLKNKINCDQKPKPFSELRSCPNGIEIIDKPGANTGSGKGKGSKNANCTKANMADSYVLALSWQPAFCETMKSMGENKLASKPECSPETSFNSERGYFVSEARYHASNFTLHGLWPNLKECKKNYGSCPEQEFQKPLANLADNQVGALKLKKESVENIQEVIPNILAGSWDLAKHEWEKHGTCQEKTRDGYFILAANLVKEFNHDSALASLIRKNIGRTITKTQLVEAIEKPNTNNNNESQAEAQKTQVAASQAPVESGYGPGSAGAFKVTCKNDMLVEIQISLMPVETKEKTKILPEKSQLKDLVMRQSGSTIISNCGENILIDKIGF